jgi:hypothetical protein
MRVVVACALAALAVAGAAGAAGTPPAADRSTARLAIASGRGAHRLALWTATNAEGGLCVGWRLGGTAPPATFTCLRRGLERPVLTVQGGGGHKRAIDWGELVGLASTRVHAVEAAEGYSPVPNRRLRLRPVPGLPGWRAFATGPGTRPPNELKALGAHGGVLDDDVGLWIGTNRPRPEWSDTFATTGEDTADEAAISIALADPTVARLVARGRAWIDQIGGWVNCDGRTLGVVITLRFARPANFVATLPSVEAPSGKHSYAVSVAKVRATRSPGLDVSVDMNLHAVEGIDPTGGGLLPGGIGNVEQLAVVRPAHDTGGPDTPNCWQSTS